MDQQSVMKGGSGTAAAADSQRTEHVVKYISFATKDALDTFWRVSKNRIKTGVFKSYIEPFAIFLNRPDLLNEDFIHKAFDKLKLRKEESLSEVMKEGVRIGGGTRVYPIIIDYHSGKTTMKIFLPKIQGSEGTMNIFAAGAGVGNLTMLNDSVAKGLLIRYGEEDVPSQQVHTRKYLGQQGYQAITKDTAVQQFRRVNKVLGRPIAQLFKQVLTDSFYQDRGTSDDIYSKLINPKQQVRTTLLEFVDKRAAKKGPDKMYYRRLSQKIPTIMNQSTLRSVLSALTQSTEAKTIRFARINQLLRSDMSQAAQAGKMPADRRGQAAAQGVITGEQAFISSAQTGKMPAVVKQGQVDKTPAVVKQGQVDKTPAVQQGRVGKTPAVQVRSPTVQGQKTQAVQAQHQTLAVGGGGAVQKPGSRGIYSRLSSDRQRNQRASFIGHLITFIPRIQAFVGSSRRVIVIDGINYLYKKYSKSFNELGDLDLFNRQFGTTGSSFFESLNELFNRNYKRWSPGFDDAGGHARIIWVMPSSKRGNDIDIESDGSTMVIRCGYPTTTWRKNRNDDATVLMVAIALKNEGKEVVIWSGDRFLDWIDKNTGNPIVKQLTVRRFQQLRRSST